MTRGYLGFEILARQGAVFDVNSYSDVERLFPASGGVHTINKPVRWNAEVMVLPTGVSLAMTGGAQTGGVIRGILAVRTYIIGNVAGPLISGDPLMIANVTLVNLNPAGSHMYGTSTSGATMIIREVIIGGPAVGGRLENFGNASFEGMAFVSCADGITLDGSNAGARMINNTGLSSMPAGAVMFRLADTCSFSVGLAVFGNSYQTQAADQYIMSIDTAATLPSEPLPSNTVGVRLQNNSAPGGGEVMDQAGINESDIRIMSTGNLYAHRSLMFGQASFSDAIAPIDKSYSGTSFEPIPYSNGAGGVIALVSTSQRFSLILDDPNPGDWYLRYDGPLDHVQADVSFSMSLEAKSTSSILSLRAEHYGVETGFAWDAVVGSPGVRVQQNNLPGIASGRGSAEMYPGDRFRVASANDNAAANTLLTAISLYVSGDL